MSVNGSYTQHSNWGRYVKTAISFGTLRVQTAYCFQDVDFTKDTNGLLCCQQKKVRCAARKVLRKQLGAEEGEIKLRKSQK